MCESRHLISLYRSYCSFYLIISNENECLGTIATVEQGEQIATVAFDTMLWHNKLGHMCENCIELIHSKKVLLGQKCVNMDFCESGVYGK